MTEPVQRDCSLINLNRVRQPTVLAMCLIHCGWEEKSLKVTQRPEDSEESLASEAELMVALTRTEPRSNLWNDGFDAYYRQRQLFA